SCFLTASPPRPTLFPSTTLFRSHEDTLSVTMEEMLHHTRAARRGVQRALLVADMPYGSFHVDPATTVANALRFVREAGAQAVKRSEEHTSELQSRENLVCRLLLE